MEKINRFELITPKGREVVLYKDGMYYDLQDDGRTLKVFTEPNKTLIDFEIPCRGCGKIYNGAELATHKCSEDDSDKYTDSSFDKYTDSKPPGI